MRRVMLGALVAVCACFTSCNEIVGAHAPELDDRVVPCAGLADCEEAARECEAEPECVDGFCAYEALEEIPCYGGPPGTEGQGICHGGFRACGEDHFAHPDCVGEQQPEPETCLPAEMDDDCDGQVDEAGQACVCGDGVVSPEQGEECDDGNSISTDGCKSCKLARCGDGTVQPVTGETCDDGGTADGNNCSPVCQLQEVLAVSGGGRPHVRASFGWIGQVLGPELLWPARCWG